MYRTRTKGTERKTMRRRHIHYIILSMLISLALCTSGYAAQAEDMEPAEAVTEYPEDVISMAIYPYVPDVELFEQVLLKQWEEIDPDVELEFVPWDCYYLGDPCGIDVITYDALFTSYLAENGFIQPISEDTVENVETVLPFAMDGAYHEGQLYGIPYLVCSYFLIHDVNDAEMAAVDNFVELYEVVSQRKAADDSKGLVANFSSDYPYYLLDAIIDFSGEYTVYEEIPDLKNLDISVAESIYNIEQMLAAEPEENQDHGIFRRATLFNEGIGSAYYGYSEDISFMDDIAEDLTIRTISYSDKENIQLFLTDIASVGSHVTSESKKANCIKLINLIASEKFQQELCFGAGDVQYMLPARQTIYGEAGERYPIYNRLYELVTDEQNRIFRVGPDVYTYLVDAYFDFSIDAYMEEMAG